MFKFEHHPRRQKSERRKKNKPLHFAQSVGPMMTKYLISLLPVILFRAPSVASFISVGCKWQKRRGDSGPVTLDLCYGEIDTATCLKAPRG